MTDDPDLQVALPSAGDETQTLLGALDRNRRTFAWKCFGLTHEETLRTLGPSTVTLAGLTKHMALIEDYYFSLGLGRHLPSPWADIDFDAHPDWEWSSALHDPPDQLVILWEAAVGRSRAAVTAFLADHDLGSTVAWTEREERPNLRRTLVDMIEEYARHTGHADLIRESIDGLVGEDAPR